MVISQKQTILTNIEQILDFDFDELIAENNSGNIADIKFGDYTVSEFKSIYIKVFKQLKSELESGLNLMLPNQETFNNEFASVTLDVESSNFLVYLKDFVNKDNAAEILKRFVYYQIRQGFWDRSSIKQHSIDLQKLNHAKEEILLVQQTLTANQSYFEELKLKFEKQIEEFEIIINEKNEESAKISNLLSTSEVESKELADLLVKATSNDSEISTLLLAFKEKLVTITENIDEYTDSFSEIESNNSQLAKDLKKDIETAQINLKDSKEGNIFIQSQKNEIIRLIGLAADGSLGYKFNSRKEDLEKGITTFWRWAVPGSIILSLIWVVVVFTVLSAHLGNEWINLAVNLIKTSPAWILVGFVFTQYGKERNLQEEYAFKSAIAMTLTSYSQMLSEVDSGDTVIKSSKEEMLLKSIENLYTQPKLFHEKSDSESLLNSKQFTESLKSISEMVKNIKS